MEDYDAPRRAAAAAALVTIARLNGYSKDKLPSRKAWEAMLCPIDRNLRERDGVLMNSAWAKTQIEKIIRKARRALRS